MPAIQAQNPHKLNTHAEHGRTQRKTHAKRGKGSIPERTKATLVQLVGEAEVEAEVRRRVEPDVRQSAVASGNR